MVLSMYSTKKFETLTTPIVTQDMADKVTNAIMEFMSKVSKISGVTKVVYKPKGNTITIWTYIQKPDKDLQFSVYEIEQQLMEKFPELIFDFTIIFKGKEIPTGFYEVILE